MTRMSLGSLLSERLAKNRALTQIQIAADVAVRESVASPESIVSAPIIDSAPLHVDQQETIHDTVETAQQTVGEASEAIVNEMFTKNVAETDIVSLLPDTSPTTH